MGLLDVVEPYKNTVLKRSVALTGFSSIIILSCCLQFLFFTKVSAQSYAEQNPCAPLTFCGTASTQTSYSGNPYSSTTSHLPLGCMASLYNVVFTKITIATSGTFQFTITPNSSCDDYDWILYKINPAYPCTQGLDSAIVLRCDANDIYHSPGGLTGTSDTALTCCSQGGGAGPAFLSAITAAAGDVYLIGILNAGSYGCSPSSTPNSPFNLSFAGSTATIQNVTPVLTSSLTPAAICNNTAFSYTPTSVTPYVSYSWSRGMVTGISNVAASGTGNPNETLHNTSSSPVTVTYVYTLSSEGCTNTQNVSVTVNPTPTLTSTTTPPAICDNLNQPFSYTPTGSVSNTTFAWSRAALTGISNAAASGTGDPNEMLINTSSAPITVNYIYTLSANGCTNPTTYNVAVVVKPSPTLSSTLTPTSICTNTAFSYNPASSVTGAAFLWNRSAQTGISNPTANGNGNPNETLINTGSNPITVPYVYTIIANACSNSQVVNVIVNPTPTLSSSLSTDTICNNTTFSYIPTSATPLTVFSWNRAAVVGISNAAASGTGNPNETLINASANPLTVNYIYTLSANGCTNPTTYTVPVVVNPTPVLTSSLTPPAICTGTSFSYVPLSNVSGATFAWSRAAITGISNAAASGNGNPNEILVNTTANPVTVNYTYTLSANGCTNPTTYSVSVVVNPIPQITVQPTNDTLCYNASGTFPFSVAATGTGLTYQWQVNTGTGYTNVSNPIIYSGATTNVLHILGPVSLSMNGYQYQCVVSGNCTIPFYSSGATLVVNNHPLITSQQSAATVCTGSNAAFGIVASGVGLTYQWQLDSGTGFVNISNSSLYNGTTNNVLNITPATAGMNGYHYRCIISGTCSPPATGIGGLLVVNSPVVIANQPSGVSVCPGDITSFSVSVNGSPTAYIWQVNAGSGFNNISNSGVYNGAATNSLSISPVSASMNGYLYRCIISGNCSTPVTSSNAALTINPAPSIIIPATNSAVCQGGNTTFSLTASGVNLTYQWQLDSGSGFNNISNSATYNSVTTNTLSLTSVGTSMNGYRYRCIITGICNFSTISNPDTLFINSFPSLTSSATPPAICNNTVFSYIPVSSASATTFNWNRSAVAGISNTSASGTGNPNETLTNTTTSPLTVTYIYTLSSNGCASSTNYNVSVVVNPTPVLTSTLAPSPICNNTAFSYTPTASVPGASYTWSRSAVQGIDNAASNGSGNPNEILTDTNSTPVTVNYIYTVSINGCANPTTYSVNVAVNPSAALTSILSPPAICNNTAFSYTPTSNVSAASFAWSRAAITGISNAPANGLANPSEILTNASPNPVSVIYVYTLSANGCTNPVTYSVQLTVNPSPALTSNSTPPAICNSTAFSYTPASTTPGAYFAWTRLAATGINNPATSGSGNPNEMLTDTSSNPVTVNYVYTLSANGCTNPAPFIVSATVEPSPALSSISTTSTICNNTIFSFAPTSNTPGATFIWSRAAISGINNIAANGTGNPNEILVNTTVNPIDVVYVYTLGINACVNSSGNNIVVTVNPTPVLNSVTTPFATCSNTAFSYTPTSTTSGANFIWNRAVVPGISNPPFNGTGNPNETLVNTSANSVAVTYVYTVGINGCTNPAFYSVVDTVNPIPTLSNTNTSPTICNNTVFNFTPTSATPGTTFTWSRAAITGISNPAANGIGNPNEILVNTSSSPIIVTYVYTLNANGCSNTQNVYVTINPTPLLTSTLNPPSLCNYSIFSYNPTSSTANTNFYWSRAAVTSISNTSASGSGNPSETLIDTAGISELVTYIYTLSANGCTNPVTYTVVDTVNVAPYVITQPTNQVVCAGNNTSFSVSAAGSGLIYQWIVNTGSGYITLSNGGIYSGATTNTLTINGATAAMANYQYQCNIFGECVPAVLTSIVTLTVNTVPTIATYPAGNIVCAGGNATFSVVANSAISYQWFVNQGSGFNPITNGGLYSGATTNILSVSGVTTSMNSYQYQCLVTGNCVPSITTPSVLLFVNTLLAILSQSPDTAICAGNNASFSVSAAGTGITYQWQLNTGTGFGNISNAGAYSGTTNNILNIGSAAASMNGYQYRCIVSGICTPPAISSFTTLTVNTAPAIVSQPSASVICAGSNTVFSVLASGTGLNYQWQVNAGTGFSNINNSGPYNGSGTNSVTIVSATNSMNAYQYRCIVTGTCSPPVMSNAAMLTVNALPLITVQATDTAICAGSNTSFTVSASGTALTYQWQLNTGTGFANIVNTGAYSNATTAVLSLANVTASMNAYHYRCIVSGACLPPDTSNSYLLTVNTAPTISSQSANDTICDGGSAIFSVNATGTALSYQWQVYTGAGYVNLNNTTVYGGTTTNILSITNANVSLNGNQYRCVVSGTCTPFVNSLAVVLVVNSLPSVILQPVNSTICAGSNTSFDITASGTGINYQWQINTGSGFNNLFNSTVYNGATTNTLSIVVALASMNGYTFRCLVSGTCSPQAISNTTQLSVNTAPFIAQQATNSTICNGTNTTFTLSATGTGIVYQWQENTVSGFVNLSNSGLYSGVNTNAFSLTSAADSVSGKIYRCLINGACPSSVISNLDTLIVNDSLSFTSQPQSHIICSGNSTSFFVNVTGTQPSYQWQVNTGLGFVNVNNGGVYSGENTDSLVLTGASTTMSGYQYRCTVSGPCTPYLISNIAGFTVNPVPPAFITENTPLIFCPNDSVILFANTALGLTYQWQVNNVNIPGAINDLYIASNPGNYTVLVSNANNCTTISSSTLVSNYPSPSANIVPSGPTTFCSNDSIILNAGSGNGSNYQWQYDGIDIYNAADSIFTTNVGGSYTITVTNAYNCVAVSPPTVITVNFVAIPPLYTLAGYLTFCDGDSVLVGTNANYLSYQWQRNGIDIPGDTTNQCSIHTAGQYNVVITTALCTASSAFDNVTVNPLPIDSLILNGPPVICSAIGNYVLAAYQAAGQTYNWYKNGLIIYGATSAIYAATIPDGYNVQILSAQGCSIFTRQVDVTYSVSPNPLIAAQGMVLNTGIYDSYQWYRNNVIIPGAVNQNYTTFQNGLYSVSVTDSNTCSGTSAQYNINNVDVPNISASASDVHIYPNPATSIVYIEAPISINLVIMDIQGKSILQKDNPKYIDISGLANGVYMIKVYDDANTLLKTEKLIKNSW